MNDTRPQRVAMVTGGARRVGRAVALALAEAGYDLVVAYRTSGEAAEALGADVSAMGRRCAPVRADLAEADAADAIVAAARQSFGRLDLVVNSASSFEPADLLDVDADAWDDVMAVNARAPHLIVRAAAELLRTARGSVVNIVDLSAFQPWTAHPHHAVSKAALAHLTRVQARALAPDVRVNAVAPGAVLRPEAWSSERWKSVAARAPLRRAGTPEDVAAAVLYLAEADFVTGQILVVDGGASLGG